MNESLLISLLHIEEFFSLFFVIRKQSTEKQETLRGENTSTDLIYAEYLEDISYRSETFSISSIVGRPFFIQRNENIRKVFYELKNFFRPSKHSRPSVDIITFRHKSFIRFFIVGRLSGFLCELKAINSSNLDSCFSTALLCVEGLKNIFYSQLLLKIFLLTEKTCFCHRKKTLNGAHICRTPTSKVIFVQMPSTVLPQIEGLQQVFQKQRTFNRRPIVKRHSLYRKV